MSKRHSKQVPQRVGHFAMGEVRPIIVQLRTVWDKSITLARPSKFKDLGESIYIAADESLEIRRLENAGSY